MENVNVSVLDPAARRRDGKKSSAIVTAEAPLTPELVAKEAWSPTRYTKPRRAKSNFLEAQAIGLDIDEKITLAQAIEQLAGYECIVGTTENHQKVKNAGTSSEKPACDRFRVILPLSEPVYSVEDFVATLEAAASLLKLPFDEQAKDAARWFIPCRQVVYVGKGRRVSPTAQVKSLVVSRPAPAVTGARGQLSRSTLEFLVNYKETGGEWHRPFIKAAMDFKEQGYTEEEAASRLATASPHGALDETDYEQLADVFANRGGALSFRPNWPVMIPARNGNPARPNPTSPANLKHLLTQGLQLNFGRNERRSVIYQIENGKYSQLTDHMLSVLKTRARDHGLSAEIVVDTVTEMAVQNSFDPLMETIELLRWDGHDHITDLFKTITIPKAASPEHVKWYYTFLARWLVGCVAKVYVPGSQNLVLVFQGGQGAGKNRWLERLGQALWAEGFGEGSVNPDDKDHELRHLDNFIWHVGELDYTTGKKEAAALKDYFTKQQVTVRRPYERFPVTGRSICSFCASVNNHEFLHDPTGNRRYLVIPLTDIDHMHEVNLEQVWAQAKALYKEGEQFWYDREEIKVINSMNEKFISKEDYIYVLEDCLKPGTDEMSLSAIREALPADIAESFHLNKSSRANIRAILDANGVQAKAWGRNFLFLVDKELIKNYNKKKV